MRVFTDADVLRQLTPSMAIEAISAALIASANGELACPPRVIAPLRSSNTDAGALVFTAGATSKYLGYRSYVRDRELPPGVEEDQLVTAFDRVTGKLCAIAVGSLLGMRRTGALGGVAAQCLAGAGPHTLAFIGAGHQSRQQLWALNAVVDIADVRVFARTSDSRDAFAYEARSIYGLRACAVDSAHAAVDGASIVVIATGAHAPVIDASWLAADCMVTSLGMSTIAAHEIPADIFTGAFTTTDAFDQCTADPTALLPPGGATALTSLGHILTGQVAAPCSGRRIYLSRGLAGSEVALLAALAGTPRP